MSVLETVSRRQQQAEEYGLRILDDKSMSRFLEQFSYRQRVQICFNEPRAIRSLKRYPIVNEDMIVLIKIDSMESRLAPLK